MLNIHLLVNLPMNGRPRHVKTVAMVWVDTGSLTRSLGVFSRGVTNYNHMIYLHTYGSGVRDVAYQFICDSGDTTIKWRNEP